MENINNDILSFSGSPEYVNTFNDENLSLSDNTILGATDSNIIATYDDMDSSYMITYYGDKCPNWSEIKSGVRKGRNVTTSVTYANNQLVKLNDLTFSFKYGKLTITYNYNWGGNVSFYNPNNNGEYLCYSTTRPSFTNMTGLNNYCATYNTAYTFEYRTELQGSTNNVHIIAHQQWKPGYYSFAVYTGNPAHFLYYNLTQANCNTLNSNPNVLFTVPCGSIDFTLNG
jgi:hypothetical protein